MVFYLKNILHYDKNLGGLLMKKQLAATVLITGIMASGTAFAADTNTNNNNGVTIDGSLSIHYRDQSDKSDHKKLDRNGIKTTLSLNTAAPIAKNLSAYANLNYQIITNNDAPWMADYYPANDDSCAAISAYGLKYKNAGYSYVAGKQSLTLGDGLAYDNGYIGKNDLPYALSISKKTGNTNISAIIAKTSYQAGIDNDKFFAIQCDYALTHNTQLGAMFAHVSYGKNTINEFALPDSTVNFYNIYGTHDLSKLFNLSAGYLKSSAESDNQAYQANLKYKIDKRNTLSVGYYRAEDQSDILDYNIADMTTTWNTNTKGYTVSLVHQFDKNTKLKLGYIDYKKINNTSNIAGTTDRTRLYATAIVNF